MFNKIKQFSVDVNLHNLFQPLPLKEKKSAFLCSLVLCGKLIFKFYFHIAEYTV